MFFKFQVGSERSSHWNKMIPFVILLFRDLG